ncbi:MAG: hypothetical protein L3J39_15080 [Verrucomicrobiales bacterium]|nr:hypothetical protein [Verrucomicrobiales bacterium]
MLAGFIFVQVRPLSDEVVAASAEIEQLPGSPGFAFIGGDVGLGGVASFFDQQGLHGDDYFAAASLDHIADSSAVTFHDALGIDPGFAIVKTAHRPKIESGIWGGTVFFFVPLPFALAGEVHEYENGRNFFAANQSAFVADFHHRTVGQQGAGLPGFSIVSAAVRAVVLDGEQVVIGKNHKRTHHLSGYGGDSFFELYQVWI